MSPEEKKADELLTKYLRIYTVERNTTPIVWAKAGAIICVEEILSDKHSCGCEQSIVIDGNHETYLTYWNKVLEILKTK